MFLLFLKFIVEPLTRGSKLSVDVDLYNLFSFLCGHSKGCWRNSQQAIGLIAGVHSNHCLTALSIKGSMARHHNTCVEVSLLSLQGRVIFGIYSLHTKIRHTIINQTDTKWSLLPKVCMLDNETLYSSLFSGVASSRS